jgi:hypothetical protein
VGLGVGLTSWLGRPASPRSDEQVTLSVLKSEAMAFLVTRRSVTQIVVVHSESD